MGFQLFCKIIETLVRSYLSTWPSLNNNQAKVHLLVLHGAGLLREVDWFSHGFV